MAKLHEYAFDVKMSVVMRVKAKSEKEARAAVNDIDSEDLDVWVATDTLKVKITEGSVDDVNGPHLFEVDGENVD